MHVGIAHCGGLFHRLDAGGKQKQKQKEKEKKDKDKEVEEGEDEDGAGGRNATACGKRNRSPRGLLVLG